MCLKTKNTKFIRLFFLSTVLLAGIVASSSAIAEDVEPLTVYPDFSVYCIYSPTSFAAGQDFVIGARVRNTGSVGTSRGVYAYLYVDGVLRYYWYWANGFGAYSGANIDTSAYPLKVSNGAHVFQFVMDATVQLQRPVDTIGSF